MPVSVSQNLADNRLSFGKGPAPFAGINISSSVYSKDETLMQKVQAFAFGKNIKEYNPDELTTIKTVLAYWLRRMNYYVKKYPELTKNDASINEFIKEIFDKSDPPHKNLWLALKAFAYCYGLQFNGSLKENFKPYFLKIADGTFDEPGSVYRLKTTEGHCAYNNVWKYGLEEGLKSFNAVKDTVKNKPNPMCRYYKIGGKNNPEFVKFIQAVVINLWGSKEVKNPISFTLGIVCKKLRDFMAFFNNRFRIYAQVDDDGFEITQKHLDIFKIIITNPDQLAKTYPLDDSPQNRMRNAAYNLFLADREDEKKLSAAAKHLYGSAPAHRRRSLNSRKERLAGVNKNLLIIYDKLEAYLNSKGYGLQVGRGIGKEYNNGSLHAKKRARAIDFSIYRYDGKKIKLKEYRYLAGLIEAFLKTLEPIYGKIGYIDEYDKKEIKKHHVKFSTGNHMHLSLPFPNNIGRI